jgi:GT2 family glycosyltransferase
MVLAALSDVVKQAPADAEVVIVDQSPRETFDPVAEWIAARKDPRLRHIPSVKRGLPHARNVGIRATTGRIVLFFDDDVRLHPGCIQAHLSAYSSRGVGGVVGRILETAQWPNSVRTTNRINLGGRIITNLTGGESAEIETLKGANMSFRRPALKQTGPFDENYLGTAYLEDADISVRVRRAGWTLMYEPAATLTHYSAPGGGVRVETMLECEQWKFHNTGYFMRKHRGRASWPALVMTFCAIAAKRSAQWRDPRASTALLRALRKGWLLASTESSSSRARRGR